MEKKIEDADFIGDMNGLLRSDIKYNMFEAYEKIKKKILNEI